MNQALIAAQNEVRRAGGPVREAVGQENAVNDALNTSTENLNAAVTALGDIAGTLQGVNIDELLGRVREAESKANEANRQTQTASTEAETAKGPAEGAVTNASTARGIVESAAAGVPGTETLIQDAAGFQNSATGTQEAVGAISLTELSGRTGKLPGMITDIGVAMEALKTQIEAAITEANGTKSDVETSLASIQQAQTQATQAANRGGTLAGQLEGFTIVGVPGGS